MKPINIIRNHCYRLQKRKKIQIRHRGLIVAFFVLTLCSTGLGFPLEQFKEFIIQKPSVEKIAFKLRSSKYRVGDLGSNEFRSFALVYQDHSAFSLVEDRAIPAFLTATNAGWGRNSFSGIFEDEYWHSFNSVDVITGSVQDTLRQQRDPKKVIQMPPPKIRLAYDLLNLGIFDVGTNRIYWSGLSITCPINEIGARIQGQLYLSEVGVPETLKLSYTHAGKVNRYEVSYGYDTSRDLPGYFPSRIRVDFVDGDIRSLLSEYEILSVKLSDRMITREDVHYAKELLPSSKHFIIKSGQLFLTATNANGKPSFIPVLQGEKEVNPSSTSRILGVIALVGILFAPILWHVMRIKN
jgi:hypothetical protein